MQKNYTLFYLFSAYQNENAKSYLIRGDKHEEQKMINQNQQANYSPSERVLKAILDFAKSYDTVKTVSTGYVELNLN